MEASLSLPALCLKKLNSRSTSDPLKAIAARCLVYLFRTDPNQFSTEILEEVSARLHKHGTSIASDLEEIAERQTLEARRATPYKRADDDRWSDPSDNPFSKASIAIKFNKVAQLVVTTRNSALSFFNKIANKNGAEAMKFMIAVSPSLADVESSASILVDSWYSGLPFTDQDYQWILDVWRAPKFRSETFEQNERRKGAIVAKIITPLVQTAGSDFPIQPLLDAYREHFTHAVQAAALPSLISVYFDVFEAPKGQSEDVEHAANWTPHTMMGYPSRFEYLMGMSLAGVSRAYTELATEQYISALFQEENFARYVTLFDQEYGLDKDFEKGHRVTAYNLLRRQPSSSCIHYGDDNRNIALLVTNKGRALFIVYSFDFSQTCGYYEPIAFMQQATRNWPEKLPDDYIYRPDAEDLQVDTFTSNALSLVDQSLREPVRAEVLAAFRGAISKFPPKIQRDTLGPAYRIMVQDRFPGDGKVVEFARHKM